MSLVAQNTKATRAIIKSFLYRHAAEVVLDYAVQVADSPRSHTMRDASTQTDLPAPPAYDSTNSFNALEGVERLKRFLVYSLKREYNADMIESLSFRESGQWNTLGYDPAGAASRDRQKFERRLDEFIEVPCRLLGVSARQVWNYTLAQGLNFFRDSKFREFVRERCQTSPQQWGKKLLSDRALIDLVTTEPAKIEALKKAIDKEIGEHFARLESDTDWQLSPKGEAHWSWRRTWMR